MIDWVKVLCSNRHRICHFEDVFPSKSLGKLHPPT